MINVPPGPTGPPTWQSDVTNPRGAWPPTKPNPRETPPGYPPYPEPIIPPPPPYGGPVLLGPPLQQPPGHPPNPGPISPPIFGGAGTDIGGGNFTVGGVTGHPGFTPPGGPAIVPSFGPASGFSTAFDKPIQPQMNNQPRQSPIPWWHRGQPFGRDQYRARLLGKWGG